MTLGCPAVAGKPNCSQWDFDSGDVKLEGWELGPGSAVTSSALSLSTAQHSSGPASLAIRFNNSGDTTKYIELRVKLCAGGNVLSLTGKNAQWAYHSVPASSGGYNYFQVYGGGPIDSMTPPTWSGAGGLFDFNADSDGVWDYYDNPMDAASVFDNVYGVGFHLQMTMPFNGTIYLDAVRLY